MRSGEVGERLVDEVGLGAHAGERRRLGALEELLPEREAHDELEHEPDVVAPVGRGEPCAAPAHEPFDDLADLVRTGPELGLDRSVLRVAQPVAVDDGGEQLGSPAEVVVEGRRVALAGELVDVTQGHVEPLAGHQVERGAQEFVLGAVGLRRCRGRAVASVLIYRH